MNISYSKVVNEIFKILVGLGYTVNLYDEDGNGPISSPYKAKYITTLQPDFLMIDMPSETADDTDKMIIYKTSSINPDIFKNIFDRIKNITSLYGIEVTVRDFSKDITPKDFSYKSRARREEIAESLNNPSVKTSLKSLLNKRKK